MTAETNIPAVLSQVASLPVPAAPPTLAELNKMLAKVKSSTGEISVGSAVYLGEDWQTQGDWVGRYGRQYAVLCAAAAPLDHNLISDPNYKVSGNIGPNRKDNDSMRRWVSVAQTSSGKSLYDPIPGYRRQAEWDDHGEDYSTAFDGPDIWVTVTVPNGVHRISLYDVNKDGHDGGNRNRDYLVDLLPYNTNMALDDTKTPLARARIHDFWNGAYKSFLVRGPAKYYVHVVRNSSFNTILAGVFLDKETGPKTRRDCVAWMGGIPYNPPDPDKPAPIDPHLLEKLLAKKTSMKEVINFSSNNTSPSITAARMLWSSSNKFEGTTQLVTLSLPYRVSAYRAVANVNGCDALQAAWRWRLGLWIPEDRQDFKEAMTRAHDSLLDINPQMRDKPY